MAANDYYNPSAHNHSSNYHLSDQQPPPPPPASTKPPTSLYTNYPPPDRASNPHSPYSNSGMLDSPSDNPHHSRDSYYSSQVAGGTLHDERQYADNIPLKSPQPRPYSQDDPARQSTHYPPSPESQQPPKSRRKKKTQGWFRGKITWVVYAATLVQLGVFIGEIIENGELLAFLFSGHGLTNGLSIKRPRQAHRS